MSFVVGLTGGIGSGKSTVAALFAGFGAALIDTDAIAHALTAAGGSALGAIRAAFGEGVLAADGALDRAAMRRRVFADPAERRRLETILHPLIRAEAEAQLRRAAGADFPYVVLVVPLLAESGAYQGRVARIAVVDCPVEQQIARVMARNGLARAEVEAILSAQATREARLAIADDVILNDAGFDRLEAEVGRLHRRYLEVAQSAANPPES